MDKTFAHIQVRRDTEERWSRLDPDLLEGEWGFEVDTGNAKLGIKNLNHSHQHSQRRNQKRILRSRTELL